MTEEADAATMVQTIKENAQRLGLTWQITMATIVDGSDSQSILATFDGDEAPTIGLISMVGAIAKGQRVYVVSVPPAGNYIAGLAVGPRGIIGGNYMINGGFAASSTGLEVAVPAGSWNQQPILTFRPGYFYTMTIQYGPNTDGAAAQWGFFKIRKGSGTITGNILHNAYIQMPAGFATQGASNTQVGYLKNETANEVQTALSMTCQRVAGGSAVRIYGGDAASPTFISVREECPIEQAEGLRFVALQI